MTAHQGLTLGLDLGSTAVKAALLASMADGSYEAALEQYGVQQGAITPDVVESGQLPSS